MILKIIKSNFLWIKDVCGGKLADGLQGKIVRSSPQKDGFVGYIQKLWSTGKPTSNHFKKQAGHKYITHKTMRTEYEGDHVFTGVEMFSAKLLDTKQE